MAEQIIIENKNQMTLNTVKEVKSYNETRVNLVLNDGAFLQIWGKNLKINAFSKQTSNLNLSGEIYQIRIKKGQENFFKKVLK